MILESEFINFPESMSLSMHEYESAWRKALDNVIIISIQFPDKLQKTIKISNCSDNISIENEGGYYSLTLWCDHLSPCLLDNDDKGLRIPCFPLKTNKNTLIKIQFSESWPWPTPTNRIISFPPRFPSGSRVSEVSACLCGLLGLNLLPLP